MHLFIHKLKNKFLRFQLRNTPLKPMALKNLKALDAADGARPARAYSYVAVDLETTGLDFTRSRIVSIGAVRIRGGRIHLGHIFNQLVNPGRHIPIEAIKIHGIGPQMVKDAPSGPEAMDTFLAYLGNDILVAHPAAFDLNFLNLLMLESHGFRLQNLVIDTRTLCQDILLPQVYHPIQHPPRFLGRSVLNTKNLNNGYTLDDAAHHLGIKTHQRHTAAGDALTCAMIFQKSLSKMENSGKGLLRHLLKAGAI